VNLNTGLLTSRSATLSSHLRKIVDSLSHLFTLATKSAPIACSA